MYTEIEVATLLHNWHAFASIKERRQFILVRVADIQRAVRILTPEERHAVAVRGIHGESLRAAAKRAGMDWSTLNRRFWSAVRRITEFLNTGG